MTAARKKTVKSAAWHSKVAEAKTYIKEIKDRRTKVSKLAVEACNITHGGGRHWRDFKDCYTLMNFAEDLGMNYKTLYEWVRQYKYIYNKLGVTEKEVSFTVAHRALERGKIKKDTPVSEVRKAVNLELVRGSESENVAKFYRYTKTFIHALKNHDNSKMKKRDLEDIRTNCYEILSRINECLKSKKA